MTSDTAAAHPKVVTRHEWLAARRDLLAREKAHLRAGDALAAARRRLPMVRIDKDYRFRGPAGWGGEASLADLFDGRRQLIVYHFMFDPGDPPEGKSGAPWEEGCPGCSHVADNLPHLAHVRARDTNLVMVSRAPLSKIEPFRNRMGWTVPWYSSFGSDFNYDFHATTDETVAPVEYNYKDKATLERENMGYAVRGEQHALSVFLRVGGEVFHTYSTYGRGVEPIMNTFTLLDLTPYGRQEEWEDSPGGWPQTPPYAWWRHHDRYEEQPQGPKCCCHPR